MRIWHAISVALFGPVDAFEPRIPHAGTGGPTGSPLDPVPAAHIDGVFQDVTEGTNRD